ncbi:hypothetical protein Bbelb_002150 [Branchiostoma belcheri]|nr:hypothetical protein Bbelb_002150 [Branchiostoma belcheri]
MAARWEDMLIMVPVTAGATGGKPTGIAYTEQVLSRPIPQIKRHFSDKNRYGTNHDDQQSFRVSSHRDVLQPPKNGRLSAGTQAIRTNGTRSSNGIVISTEDVLALIGYATHSTRQKQQQRRRAEREKCHNLGFPCTFGPPQAASFDRLLLSTEPYEDLVEIL